MRRIFAAIAALTWISSCSSRSSGPEPVAVEAPPQTDAPEQTDPDVASESASSTTSGESDQVCTGSPSQELIQALSERAASTQPCFDRALRENPKLEGRMQLKVRIEPDGSVSLASVIADEVDSQTLRDCVLLVFQQPVGARPTGGCLDAVVPLNFRRKAETEPDGGT